MALPKYTAQLRDQLRLKQSQAILAAAILTMGPPLAIGLLIEDQRLYDEIIKPIAKFFGYYALIIWGATAINVLLLALRIKNLTDSSENQS